MAQRSVNQDSGLPHAQGWEPTDGLAQHQTTQQVSWQGPGQGKQTGLSEYHALRVREGGEESDGQVIFPRSGGKSQLSSTHSPKATPASAQRTRVSAQSRYNSALPGPQWKYRLSSVLFSQGAVTSSNIAVLRTRLRGQQTRIPDLPSFPV